MEAALAGFKALLASSTPPSEVAEVVFEAIRNEQFYILPHPEWIEAVQLRTDKLLRMENPQNPSEVVARLATQRK